MLHAPRARAAYLMIFVVAPMLVIGTASGAIAAAKRTPTPVITAGPQTTVATRAATFSFTDTAAGAAFSCALDAGAFVACVSPRSYSGLSEATHTFKVRAVAAGMRTSAIATRTWTVDVTPPVAPVISPVPSPTGLAAVSITFASSSSGVAGYVCSLDAAPEASCVSPSVVDPGVDGSHVYTVTAVDLAGNRSVPASVRWFRDTTTPVPVVNAGPATRSADTLASFDFASSEAQVTFTCSLDGGGFAACTSPASYTGLSTAAHTFRVRATDSVGNTADSAAYAWTVDPSVAVSLAWQSFPAGVTKLSTAQLTFAATGQTTLTCHLDGATLATCASPVDLAGLTEGAHTIVVVADEGLASETQIAYAWTVDTTPPPAPHIDAPSGFTTATSADVQVFYAAYGDTLVCTMDTVPLSCNGPSSFAGLAEGVHTVQASESDVAGNVSTATATWTVDVTAPVVGITVPTTLVAPVHLTFTEPVHGLSTASAALRTSTGAAVATRLTCYTDLGALTSCASGLVRSTDAVPVAALVPGEHYVGLANAIGAATIVDRAGNPATPGSVSFRGALAQQENSPAARYGWRRVGSASALGGSYVSEHRAASSASFTFSGTWVTWYTVTGPTFGQAAVYVDGVRKPTVNNYASLVHYRVPRSVSGLKSGTHTLVVVVTGLRGSRIGRDAFVAVDAVRVGSTTWTTPSLRLAWPAAATSAAWGGRYVRTDLAGDYVSFTFRGTAVRWIGVTGPAFGRAAVYIDGVLVTTIDSYSAAARFRVGRSITGLADRRHTLVIVVLGTHRTGAKGSYVAVDGFTVT